MFISRFRTGEDHEYLGQVTTGTYSYHTKKKTTIEGFIFFENTPILMIEEERSITFLN